MNILAVDTSGPVAGIAILKDGCVTFEETVVNKLTHSANLMPMIDAALTRTGMTLKDMHRLAVVVGPGSFTGVRIGVSTVKGLSPGSGIPCVAVDALQAMAAGVPYFDGIVCPIQDARAGQVYGAAFTAGEVPTRLLEDDPLKLEDYVAQVKSLGERFCFLGDGMPVHRARLAELLGDQAIFASANVSYLRPASVALLAAQPDAQELDYLTLMPLYLRAPQAERNRALQEAMKHV